MSVFGLPWGDWQFYATTLLAAGGLWWLRRSLRVPRERQGTAPPCAHCSSGGCAPDPTSSSPLRILR